MKLMNKIQNQKMNNSFEQLVGKKTKGNNKFKDMLDIETDTKHNKMENKPKDNIKNEKNDYRKEDKKETKQTDKSDKKDNIKNEEQDEDKEKKTISRKDIYMFLSELLDIPMDELKEMNLQSIMDQLSVDLETSLDLESLNLEDIDLTQLQELLSEMDLDVEDIHKDDEFIGKLVDKLNEKVSSLEEDETIETKLSSIINENSNSDKKEKIDLTENKLVQSEDIEIEELNIENDESADMSDEFSKDDNNNVKNKSDKKLENLDSRQKIEDVDTEIDSEPTTFDTIVRRENNLLLDVEGNVVQNLEEVDQQDVIEQITSKMEFNLTDDNQEVKINLKPNHLGEMVMNLEVTKGEVAAKITVDNYKTKEILEANIMTLQEELEDTGMEIKSFEVFVGQDSDFQRDGQERFNFFNHNSDLKKKNNKNKLNVISTDYEAATIEEDRNLNRIVDGSMDLQA